MRCEQAVFENYYKSIFSTEKKKKKKLSEDLGLYNNVN